uniref:Uncharacterized protein n=1 Tax=Rhizophora mucronata TaxID=61149 RepID=A0A2P2NH85_RHIMU
MCFGCLFFLSLFVFFFYVLHSEKEQSFLMCDSVISRLLIPEWVLHPIL